ncbi:TRNA methyltransferase 10-like protein A [Aphelenchoides bicaudatus]|nr:TRNA methyltransferase 10-like protein A [Aphelenchoides bicaudatus]
MSQETVELFDEDEIGQQGDAQETDEQADLNEEDGQPALSKNQMRKQRRRAKQLENRAAKRAAEKTRQKEKRKALREAGQFELLKKPTFYDMASSTCPIHVAVDMSYEQYMNEELIRKTINQLNFSYSANRRAKEPLKYHVTSLSGKTKEIFDTFPGYKTWDVFMHEEPVAEIWPANRVVYLTSDSPNVLVDLDPNKVYIIGGLLDHNSYPGLSLKIADRLNFGHARLPIDEYVKLQTRKVLTINHVFEIILRYYETKDWEKSFFTVIPKRKGMERREEAVQIDSKTIGITPMLTETQNVIEVPGNSQPNEAGEPNVIQLD